MSDFHVDNMTANPTYLSRQCFRQMVAPPFHFNHLPTQVQRSLYWLKGLEYALICAHFLGGLGFKKTGRLKKKKQFQVFCSSPLWNLNFDISKVNFHLSFWSFWDMMRQDVSFLSLDKQFITSLWASFHAKFWLKD